MSPECIFFGCKHDLKNLQEADGLLYIYFWHAYRTEANGLLKRTS